MCTWPDEPFTVADLRSIGIQRTALTAALAGQEVRRLLRGVYVAASVTDSAELRIRALARVINTGHIACDRTAAWLHGIDVFGGEVDQVPPIEVCAVRGQTPTERPEIRGRTRDLVPDDVQQLGAVRVTTPLRTVLDLGCVLRRRDALAALDQFRRSFGFSEQVLTAASVRYFRRRGVVQLRQLIPLSDPRAESPRESWTRLAILDARLPAPTPQYEIEYDGVLIFRLDHAYPRARVAVEYDGEEFHRTPEQRDYDSRRRAWLREHGWTVLVVRKGDFSGKELDDWIHDLRHALRSAYTNLRW